MVATRVGSTESVKLLLEAGASPNATESERGQTALMWAAAGKHPDIVQLLIEHGADPITRPYGYARMPRFGSGWQAAEIAPLSDKQRMELCTKWFRLRHLTDRKDDKRVPDESVKHDATQFMSEVSRSSDLLELSQVPFLLLLLLYLQLERAVLPTSRFQAYELMLEHLIDEHPANRRVAASLVNPRQGLRPDDVERALAFVGFEIQNTRSGGLISEEELREIVLRFLTNNVLGLGLDAAESHSLLSQLADIAEGEIGLLVRKGAKRLGFFHRSFQEYLAGVHLSRLTPTEQQSFVRTHFDDPRWRDVLLALFSMTRSPEALRALVETMTGSTLPQRLAIAEFRAEVAFGDFDCPADLAKSIAEESFVGIERGTWMPHRERLLNSCLQGLHSTKIAEKLRQHVRRWVYSPNGWQPGWFTAMQRWPADSLTLTVLEGRLNGADDVGVQRSAAQSLAGVFRGDSEVGDRLARQALESPSRSLRAAAIEGLSTGWSDHQSIAKILGYAEQCPSAEVRLAGVGARILRGERRDADFEFLIEMSRRRSDLVLRHQWSEVVEDALVKGWSGSRILKEKCLDAVRDRYMFRGEALAESTAISVLLRGYSQDPDVAKFCAREISGYDDRISQFPFIGMRSKGDAWKYLADNFKGNAIIADAIDRWLEKNKSDRMEAAQAALVGRTPKAKQVLIGALKESFPYWSAWALLEGWGMQDPEVSAALLDIVNGQAPRASEIANLIPRIISDVRSARTRLLQILRDTGCERHDLVVRGFTALSDKGDEDEIVSTCFDVVNRGIHAESIEHEMIAGFPEARGVREFTRQRLRLRNPPISAVIVAFASDPEIRAEIAEIVQPLPTLLRTRIITKLSNQPTEDQFARSILKDYDLEEDDELKTFASIAYHRGLRRIGGEPALDSLVEAMSCYGPDHQERRRAAFAGLLVLDRLDAVEPIREKGGPSEPVSIDLGDWNEPNLPLVRLVAERWQYLKSVFGDSLQSRISRWHHDETWPALCRVASEFPEIEAEILSSLDGDPKLAVNPHCLAFVARVKPRSQLLLDRCIAALSTPDANFQRGSFVAAEILAENFASDPYVRGKLFEALPIQQTDPISVRPELPLALCLGWPEDPLIEELYRWSRDIPEILSNYTAYFEVTLSHCPISEFRDRLFRHLGAREVQRNAYASRALLKSAVRRIRKDREVESSLLERFNDQLKPAEKASVPRLLASANGVSSEVLQFCANEIDRQNQLESPELGFDVVSAEIRGVYLSLLDALTGPARPIAFEMVAL